MRGCGGTRCVMPTSERSQSRKERSEKCATNSMKPTRSTYFSDGNRSTFCNTEHLPHPQMATSQVNSAMSCVELIPLEDIQSGRTFQEPAKLFSGRHPKADVIFFDTKHIVHEVPIWGVNAKHQRNDRFHDPNPWRRHGCIQKLHEIGGWVSQGNRHVRKADRQYEFVEAGSVPPLSPNAPLFNDSEAGTLAAINAFRGMPAVMDAQGRRGTEDAPTHAEETEKRHPVVVHLTPESLRGMTGRFYKMKDKRTERQREEKKEGKSPRKSSRSKRSKSSVRERSSQSLSRTQSTQSVSRFTSPLRVEGKSQRAKSRNKSSLKLKEPVSDYADTLYGIPSIRPRSVAFVAHQNPLTKDAELENLQSKMEKLSAETAKLPSAQLRARKSSTSTVSVDPSCVGTTSTCGTTTTTGSSTDAPSEETTSGSVSSRQQTI